MSALCCPPDCPCADHPADSSKKKAPQRPSEPLIEEDQAHKVEAFLMELFPERYENKKKPAGGGAGKKKDKVREQCVTVVSMLMPLAARKICAAAAHG